MADDWEDWEDESFTPAPLGGQTNGSSTLGAAILAKASQIDTSKFAGEDEEVDEGPAARDVGPPQQKKEAAKKSYESKGLQSVYEPLDDPVAEKLRQQRLVEQSDLNAAKDLFGELQIPLDNFTPKTAKDYEDFGRQLVAKYVLLHEKSSHYKALLKAVLRAALQPLDVQQTKDIETCLAGIKSDKLKEEKAATAAKKVAGKKKILNVGRSGGSAGLDDYAYDAPLDEEEDFM